MMARYDLFLMITSKFEGANEDTWIDDSGALSQMTYTNDMFHRDERAY
jgi:hypothetical protein